MEVRLLGSGGFVPTGERETCCLYVRRDDDVLLIDAGTGLRRLVTDATLLDGVRRVDIVLTHFHLDHVMGLLFLPALPVRPHVWAPGALLGGAPAVDLLERLLGPPFLLRRPSDLEQYVAEVHELAVAEVPVGRFRLQGRVQNRHPDPTLALSVDGRLAYCTDTAYDEGNAAFAVGAPLLLHEAFVAADRTDDEGHSAAGEAGRIAAAAGVEQLCLIHINPRQRDDAELLRFARGRFAASEVGRDGLRYEL